MPSKGRRKSLRRRRTKVISKGLHGASKHPLSAVQRALLGKGQVQSLRPVGGPFATSWRGAMGVSSTPWDAHQAELNRELYPDLFRD